MMSYVLSIKNCLYSSYFVGLCAGEFFTREDLISMVSSLRLIRRQILIGDLKVLVLIVLLLYQQDLSSNLLVRAIKVVLVT